MSTFLVVGGSSGIGLQVVKDLAQSGHQVYATYRSRNVENASSNITYSRMDILENDFSMDFLPDVVDGLVYCPGSINLKPFARIQPEEFLSDYHLQVGGAVKVIQQLMPRMRNAENPSIVLFSTVAVQLGLNFHSLVASSKGAIEGLTKALSAEFAPKIRVNCVAPSLTETPLAANLLNTPQKVEANAQRHPLKRVGNVNDIANMVTFLLTPQSAWITGQVFHVDGGMSSIRL